MRVVVLTGAGERAFCVGADMKNPSTSGLEYWARARPGGFGGIALRETPQRCRSSRASTASRSAAASRWCSAATSSSPATEASFGLPEPLVGRLPLDGGMTLLQRQIPHRLAMGMLLTGQRIDAARALDWGLVNEVVPRAELDAAVARWVDKILACAPLSVQAIKQVVHATGSMTPAEAQALRLPALVAALQSEDSEEGVRAFREKRKPVWQGR